MPQMTVRSRKPSNNSKKTLAPRIERHVDGGNTPKSQRILADKVRCLADKVRSLADKVRCLADKVSSLADKVRCLADKVRSLADKVRYLADKVRSVINDKFFRILNLAYNGISEEKTLPVSW